MALYLQVTEQELKHGLTKKLNGTMDIPQLSVESATHPQEKSVFRLGVSREATRRRLSL